MRLSSGARFGSYQIVAALGAGGMGEVYRARDPKLERDVAVKLLPESFAYDAERLARFEREAKTLASLNHANIAHVYGIEEQEGARALVMEFVEGEDLGRRIARGAMPVDDVLATARQIAEALEAAHEQGIVHRDLKPANIAIRSDGTVKVLDFGLAKAFDHAGGSSMDAANSPTLTALGTQMGVIVGTAGYMSPEQAKGRAVDKRADIWAFGIVLYEMLTGRRGYEAEDVSDTLAAVLTREVDWSKLPPGTPPRLVALMRDCLVRDPKQRLRDMGEARRIIDQMTTGGSGSTIVAAVPSSATAPAPAWRRALPWVVTTLALAVASAALWQARTTPAAPAVVTRARQSFKELAGLVAISRDGRKIVYTRAGGPLGFRLELREMDQFEGRAIPGTDGAITSVISPAADWIAYSSADGRIKKVPIAGGPAITLGEGSFYRGVAWGDDDSIIYAGASGLMRMSASGGAPAALTNLDQAKSESAHIYPQFLPGGAQLLFTVNYASADPQFAILDLRKGTYQTVATSGDNGQYLPNGYLVSGRGGTLFAQPFDLARLKTTGSKAPVVEGVSNIGPVAGIADYAVSGDGLLVYAEAAGGSGTVLTWRDRKGVESPLAGQVPRSWGTGSMSPDGKRVADGIAGDRGTDVWVVDLSRGTPTRLTFGGVNDNAIWTPDGRALVYSGIKDNKSGLYEIPADGSGQPKLVLEGAGLIASSFSPDGKTLLYDVPNAAGRRQIMVLPLDAGGTPAPHPLRDTTRSDGSAALSPDGRLVAFTSNETGRAEVYLMPFPGPGPKIQVSDHGGTRPRWNRNGRELMFWDAGGGTAGLYTVTVQESPMSASAPVQLFSMFAGTTWDIAPDGQHFLIESVVEGGTIVTVTNWFDELRRRAPASKR